MNIPSSLRSKSSLFIISLPLLSSEKSKSSVTIFPNLSLSFSIILNPSSNSLFPLASGCNVNAQPFITVKGVLNSCETLEIKSFFNCSFFTKFSLIKFIVLPNLEIS